MVTILFAGDAMPRLAMKAVGVRGACYGYARCMSFPGRHDLPFLFRFVGARDVDWSVGREAQEDCGYL